MTFWPQIHLSILALSLTFNAFFVLRYVWTRPSRIRTVVVLFTLTGSSILYLLVILEVGFGLFFIQSDNFDYTLASQLWRARYWHPINSLGYRDIEHPPAEFRSRKAVFVVGDSFVAGLGAANPARRFPDVLQKLLGTRW